MRKKRDSAELAQFKAIISVPLLPKHIDQVEKLLMTPNDVILAYHRLPEYGLITTESPNPLGGYSCSARQSQVSSGNAGLQFYANGPDSTAAKAVLLVKLDFLDSLGDWTLVSTDTKTALYR